jgi:regulator of sigma E protease
MSGLQLALRIVEFILAISVLAILHEFGHFLMARLAKIEVEEFGLFLPPKLFTLFTLGGTKFTINAIPFGAFVRPKGENDPEIPDGLAAANPWKRLGVLFGGPITNIVVGILLFSLVFIQTGAPNSRIVQIADLAENSPALTAGIQKGDVIVQVGEVKINSMNSLIQEVHTNLGKEITLKLQRGDQLLDVKVTPRTDPPAGQGSLGIVMSNPVEKVSLLQAIPMGGQVAYEQMKQLIMLPGQLINGQVSAQQARVVGPKGMFDIYEQARQLDTQTTADPSSSTLPAVNTLWLMAVISVALGITNLLPLPALDGGRIIFVLPELIFHKRVPAKYENLVHGIGFLLLIAFMLYVTFQDIIHPIILP